LARRVVGYAISRSIDARLAAAALKAAFSARNLPRGCVHHSDRGSQYASEDYRVVLQKHGLTGSMGRRGNPCDNPRLDEELRKDGIEMIAKQAAHARSATAKPLYATLARVALLCLDSMAAPHPRPLGILRPELPRLRTARLPRCPLQAILR